MGCRISWWFGHRWSCLERQASTRVWTHQILSSAVHSLCCRYIDWFRHAFGQWLHFGPRDLWAPSLVSAVTRGGDVFHGIWSRNGLVVSLASCCRAVEPPDCSREHPQAPKFCSDSNVSHNSICNTGTSPKVNRRGDVSRPGIAFSPRHSRSPDNIHQCFNIWLGFGFQWDVQSR